MSCENQELKVMFEKFLWEPRALTKNVCLRCGLILHLYRLSLSAKWKGGVNDWPFLTQITVKLTKLWTPEIFMECYCVARNKPIRHEKTKPQTAAVISLWFWCLLVYPELYWDWPVRNQHSWNFSGVHGFLSLTVKVENRATDTCMAL